MKLAVIESPYAGEVERNLRYLRAAMADCLSRGEAPYASHGLYTQPGVLDDTIAEERELGIRAGFAVAKAILDVGGKVAMYVDLGTSPGMQAAFERHSREGRVIEVRRLGGDWDKIAVPQPVSSGEIAVPQPQSKGE
jgi:hypothetical protein